MDSKVELKLIPIKDNNLQLNLREEIATFLRGFSVDPQSFFKANTNILVGRFQKSHANAIAFVFIVKVCGHAVFAHHEINQSSQNFYSFVHRSWQKHFGTQ